MCWKKYISDGLNYYSLHRYDVISGKHEKFIESKVVHDRRVVTMQH